MWLVYICCGDHSSEPFPSLSDKVVVVSYNILGVENASKHQDLYSNIPHRFLDWDKRKLLIREEICNYNASILCLQVVYYFLPLLYIAYIIR